MLNRKTAQEVDLYEVLGVSPDATEKEIRKAYKRMALKYHPDKQKTRDPQVQAKMTHIFVLISDAHEVLTNKEKRWFYDTKRKFSRKASQKKNSGGNGRSTSSTSSSQRKKQRHPENSNATGRAGSSSRQDDYFSPPRQARPSQKESGYKFRHEMPRQQAGANKGGHHSSQSHQKKNPGPSSRPDQVPRQTSRNHYQPEQGGSTPSKSSSSSQQRVYGIRKDGQPCLRCIQHKKYCWQHEDQEPRTWSGGHQDPKSRTGPKKKKTKESSSKFPVYGLCKDGQPCRRCIRQQKYCYQHEDQDPSGRKSTRDKSGRRARRTAHPEKGVKTFGICRNGDPCKRCINQGKYCFQHEYQAYE